MQSPVTILVNSYNHAEFLPECLDSIIVQPWENMEILVHDDCSTDNSIEIIHDYMSKDKRFKKLLIEEENRGAAKGVNWGFAEASGDYFCILCTDDRLSPNYWETTLPYFDSPDVGVVRIAVMNFGPLITTPSYLDVLGMFNPIEILDGNKIYVSSPIRMTMQKQVGELDGNTLLSDWDFWIRCLLAGWEWRDCHKPMFWRRTHSNSITVQEKHILGGGIDDFEYLYNKWKGSLCRYSVKNSTLYQVYGGTRRDLEAARKECYDLSNGESNKP
jgi:glycosyltransferase involved in cell wall biosynthesis